MIYILIPTLKELELTGKAVQSVARTLHEPHIILINYQSEMIGFPKAVNILFISALANEDCEEIVLLNNDVEIETDNWINLFRQHKGLVGGLTCHLYGDVWLYLNPCEEYPYYYKSPTPFEGEPFYVPYPPFSFLYFKRKVLEDVGLLDELFGIGYYEDYDYGLRAWLKGYPSIIEPKATYRHHLGSTMGKIKGFYPTKQAEYHMSKWSWLVKDKTPLQLVEELKRYVK